MAAGRCVRPGRAHGCIRCPRARSRAAPGTAPPAWPPPGRAPSRCAPWPAPRRCASSRRSLRHNVTGVHEASRPHGRADTARAARTGCRRRRPTPAPARDRRPERIPRCAFRLPGGRNRATPTANAGTAAPARAPPTAPPPGFRRRTGRWRCGVCPRRAGRARSPAPHVRPRPLPRRPRPAGRPTVRRAGPARPPWRRGRREWRRKIGRPCRIRPTSRCRRRRQSAVRVRRAFPFRRWRAAAGSPAGARRPGCLRSARQRRRPAGAHRASAHVRRTPPGPATPAFRHGLSPNVFRG